MMKFFTKRGSAEIVSIILIIVVIGGLTLAITKGFSIHSKGTFRNGMTQQNDKLVEGYIDVTEPLNIADPNFGGGVGGGSTGSNTP